LSLELVLRLQVAVRVDRHQRGALQQVDPMVVGLHMWQLAGLVEDHAVMLE
jgi:hypothetical protein